MSSLVPIKNTCIALAACLASGIAIAADAAPPSPPNPLVQGVSNILSKMQALPLQLLPSRQVASATAKPEAHYSRTLPGEIGCCRDEPMAAAPTMKTPAARTTPAQAPAPASPAAAAPAPAPAIQVAEPLPPRTVDAQLAKGYWQLDPSDISVKRALQRWSIDGGWQLIWELPVDFPVGAQAAFSGGFEQAVTAVALSLESSEMPIKAIFYRGNKVLRIVAKGVQ